MRPESFHLAVGISRAEALKEVSVYKPRENGNEATFDFTPSAGVTLQFQHDRLYAIRFEYFAFLQDARAAFQEEKDWLKDAYGSPRRATATLVIYDNRLPCVLAILSADPNSEQGRKGIGMLVVRYYDPAVHKADG